MRTDHHAYQRATRVSGFGFMLQAAIGLVLLVFGLAEPSRDTTFLFASAYVLSGVLVWLALIIIFYQHKLERLEALEEDELATGRGESGSIFQGAEETRVAARRLGLMHKWLMPAFSLLLAGMLVLLWWQQLNYLRRLTEEGEAGTAFHETPIPGWAVAICLGFALVSFIFSRFVAGMAKQPAWQNLRGGAGVMVGNALVLMAVAVGITFLFFEKPGVIRGIAGAIPVYMLLLAAEILLNFILNLYRPRIPGEVPRPAFDSRVLSIFAAPDNLVRSINEAVNYQFGFDITSSWGYQLLLRSFAWLLALGAVVLVGLNTMVIVEPHQQAVKLAGGAIVGEPAEAQVHTSGIMWKLPWPLQTAAVYDVARIRELPLTARRLGDPAVRLWTTELEGQGDTELKPFVVGASRLTSEESMAPVAPTDGPSGEEFVESVSEALALVDAEIILQYRIRESGGLLDYLRFASDADVRNERLNVRELALQRLALEEITRTLARMSLDEVLGKGRSSLTDVLREQVQSSFDRHSAGIEVVAVIVPTLRPSGSAAPVFEELGISHQARRERIAEAERNVTGILIALVGDAGFVDQALAEIDEWNRLRRDEGRDAQLTIDQRVRVEQVLRAGGGMAAQAIAQAERDRWVQLMDTRAQARRIANQVAAYRAAPRLYRQREMMRIFQERLPEIKKYVLGMDPGRFRIDVNLKDLDPVLGLDLGGETDQGGSEP